MVKVLPETERAGRKSMSFGSFIQTETSKDNESRMLTRLISMLSTIAIKVDDGQVVDTPFH
jgi:hypothetical protein